MTLVTPSLTYFPDPTKGRPVFNGQIFIGEPDLDPEIPANQKQATLRLEDGSLVDVGQPVLTGPGGIVVYNGSYAVLTTDGDFSLKVLNSQGSQVYYVPNNENIFDASQVGIVIEGDSTNLQNYLENRQVADYDELRNLDTTDPEEGIIDGTVITVTNSGIAGDFIVRSGSQSDDGGTIIVSNSDSNRYYQREFQGLLSIRAFGGVPDGVTDNYTAIDASLSSLNYAYLDNQGSSTITYVCDTMIELGEREVIIIDNDTYLREINGTSDPLVWCKSNFCGILGVNPSFSRIRKDTRPDIAAVVVGAKNIDAKITNITQANPAVVTTDIPHGLPNGTIIMPMRVRGMTEVNIERYTVAAATATTFQLSGTDSTSFAAYTEGGLICTQDRSSDRCFIRDVRIAGNVDYGATSGIPYSALAVVNPQVADFQSYFHTFSNLMIEKGNYGISLVKNANANSIDNIQFFATGSRTVNGGAALEIDGAIETQFNNGFHHFSPNSSSLVLRNNPRYNSINNFVCEQGGAVARCIDSEDNTGANNYFQLLDNVSGGNSFDETFREQNEIHLSQRAYHDRLYGNDSNFNLAEILKEIRTLTSDGDDVIYQKIHTGFSPLDENTTYKLIDIDIPASTWAILLTIKHATRVSGFNGAGAGEDVYMIKNWSGTVTASSIRSDTSGGSSISVNISGTTAEVRFTTPNNGSATTAHRFYAVMDLTADEEASGYTYVLYDTPTPV